MIRQGMMYSNSGCLLQAIEKHERSKLTLKEILAKNPSMVQKQNLDSTLTVKREEKLLRYGDYVIGQYIRVQ